MANKLLKKNNARKGLCALFALSTIAPFASIIIDNLPFTLSDVISALAADSAKTDSTGVNADIYVMSQDEEGYYDPDNRVSYILPNVSATGKITCTAVIKLNKPATNRVTVQYHVEDYTAIAGHDYENLKIFESTIEPGADSVKVKVNVKEQSDFSVGKKGETFFVSRAFLFVLDSAVDANNKPLAIYDGTNEGTGYRQTSDGSLYKDEIMCLCGGKYKYEYMDQVDPDYVVDKKSGKQQILMFYDYYDFLTQPYGEGAGDKNLNTYDVGGEGFYHTKYDFTMDNEKKKMDVKEGTDHGRKFYTMLEETNGGGSFRVVPYKYHSYYDSKTKTSGIYSDWLNRIIKTKLGHSYGSFNVNYLNGTRTLDNNFIEQFMIGDYQFVGASYSECPWFSGHYHLADTDTVPIKKDHYNLNIFLPLHAYEKDYSAGSDTYWAKGQDALENFQKYFNKAAANKSTPIVDKLDVGGFVFQDNKNGFTNAVSYEKWNTVVNYGPKKATTSEPTDIAPDTHKIAWFRVPNNEDEETFGMSIFHQHENNTFWSNKQRLMRGDTFFTVLDDSIPDIVNDTSRITCNTMRVNKDGKIRITIPFTEPIQCFESTYFKASVGSGQYLTFRPAKEQLPGCDVVVYEADTSTLSDINVSQITISSNILYDSADDWRIRDFAQSGGHELNTGRDATKIEKITFKNININKRKPSVTPSPQSFSDVATQSGSVSVDINDMNRGKVYYEFIKKNEDEHQIISANFTEDEINEVDKYSRSINVNRGSNANIRTNLTLPALENRSGEFYCFVKVVSDLGESKTYPENTNGVDITTGIGPIKIDNTAPKITITKEDGKFTAKERKFNILVEENADIENVQLSIKKTSGTHSEDGPFTKNIKLTSVGGNNYAGEITLTLEKIMDEYYSLENGVHKFEVDYEDFSISFSAIDRAGNYAGSFIWNGQETKDPIVLPYSMHESLKVDVSISNPSCISNIDGLNLYPLGTEFTFESPTTGLEKLEASVLKLPAKDAQRTFAGELDDTERGINITQGTPAQDNHVVVRLDKPGYYEIVIKDTLNNFYSDSFKFYITNDMTEETTNYSNCILNKQLVPKNNAWQLNDDSKLYYLDSGGSFRSENYGGIMDPLFSDVEEAKNYCLASEYQDMYLIQLDGFIASILSDNSGASGYTKAQGETRKPTAGQYWVRYKNITWDINARNVSSWGYYYYCENKTDVVINPATVKENQVLVKAMNHVADILSQNGKDVYLIDDDHINAKSGAPKLSEGQLRVSAGLQVTQTKTGAVVSGVSKAIDSNLFSNNVDIVVGGSTISYTLASNLELSMEEGTTLYCARVDGDNNFVKLNCKDGTLLKDAIKSESVAFSGVYSILEVTNQGANLFYVYVDCDAPAIQVERIVYDPYTDSSVTTYNSLNGSTRIDFYSKEFEINGEANTSDYVKEVDQYAYVAIFQKNKLITMSYLNSITPQNPVTVQDGIYDVVVGDRSGNRYTFKTYISSTDINVTFKSNADGSKLTISITNREADEILKYDVYCNGDLVDNTIASQKVFTLSGNYYAVIQDQYGNKVTTESFNFEKTAPEVSIYYIEGGYPYVYNEKEDPPHIIKTMSDDSININTNSPLMLKYDAQAIGITISGTSSDNYTINATAGTVTFNKACNFTFVVYYLDNEDNAVTYHVIYDSLEPTIKGFYTTTEYSRYDTNFAYYDIDKDAPSSLDYSEVIDLETGKPVKNTEEITYDSSFSTEYLYFQITDNTGIRNIVVTKDGKEIEYELLDQGFDGIEFYMNAEPGIYVITAYDLFNNTTSSRFTVDESIFSTAKVDGVTTLPLGPITDDGHEVIYGHSGCEITTSNKNTINFLYEDEVKGTYAFSIQNIEGFYYIGYYGLVEEGGVTSVVDKNNIIAMEGDTFVPIIGVDLTIIFNKDNTITVLYNVGAVDAKLAVRVTRQGKDFNLYNMEFSKHATTPVFTDCGKVIEPISGVVYCSKEALVSDPTGKITSITVAYNPMNDNFEGITPVPYSDKMEFKNGYYQYVITNVYGNKSVFTIIISDNLIVSVEVNYTEKDTEVFTLNSGDTFYSNKSIAVSSYNVVSVTEESGAGNVTVDGDKTTITFTEKGRYVVTIVDKNNNKAVVTLVIDSKEITYNESWLIGYNEDAILKDQGYTNQCLTVNLDQEALTQNGIVQVYFKVNGEKIVLYGYLGNDQRVAFDPEMFKNAIGSKGDGVYYVYFSNIYGDVAIKEIHYQVATTLEIERTTNMSVDSESISIDDALANGVWSNVNIKFNSTLQPGQYHFYVKNGDGPYEEQSITYVFEIPLSSSNGEIHYTIKYIDAYGNVYEFTVNLLKRELAFDTSKTNVFDYEEAHYTRTDFTFNFDSNDVTVEYSLDGSDFMPYEPNEIVFKDGVYQFRMFDKSGNQTIYTITKDSIVSIKVTVDGTKDVFFGQAVNGSSIDVTAPDSERLEVLSIKKDGELITNSDLRFTRSGHYELIVKDKFGNIGYFHFTLISNNMNNFKYEVPDDYTVSSAYYIDEKGVKVTCFNVVDQAKNTIDLQNSSEGTYEFQIKNKYDNSIITFTVTIDKSTPNAVLDGCNDGDTTTKTISLRNLNAGDIVYVYKDGTLVQKVEVSGATTIQDITESGNYRIVVENRAGATVEYTFQKLNIANGALSALVIIGLLAVSGGFFTVLLLRNRSKNDE